MKTNSFGFIGGGRITRIFLEALTNKKASLQLVVVYDTNPDVLLALKNQYPEIVLAQTIQEAASQSTVFIALHPPMIMESLDKISDTVSSDAVVISLAPKITIEKIASKLKTKKIVRMIPNATSFINEGYNSLTFSTDFIESEKIEVLNLLKFLGTTFEVAESKLEAYALLSGMLPTYFWFQFVELSKIGIQIGLSEEESKKSIQQTLIAAIKLMYESKLSPEQVMDLIPVKPMAENQDQISDIYQTKLMGLFEKIKP